MRSALEKKIYTAEDVWQLSLQGEPFELIGGELIPMTPTKLKRGRLTNWIGTLITNFVVPKKLGAIYPKSRAGYAYTAPGKVTILRGEAVLDGGDLLTGLSLRVSEIFAILDD